MVKFVTIVEEIELTGFIAEAPEAGISTAELIMESLLCSKHYHCKVNTLFDTAEP